MDVSAHTHQRSVLRDRTTAFVKTIEAVRQSCTAYCCSILTADWLLATGDCSSDAPAGRRFDRVLYTVMWLCWIVMVAVVAYVKLHAALIDGLLIDWMALMIRWVLLGCIAWVVETLIEMRLMPWRFMD